ncbi:hypothetical protein KKC00_01395 [Patescibacteria group bacterium]|nr:hypothetical protein [Patescibacteria group bacterium]
MKIFDVIIKIVFMILLLAAAVAFFLYKQYMFAFLTLVLMLVVSKWDRVKKLIAGRGRVEMQIEKEKKEK